jgi:hypothetical protein
MDALAVIDQEIQRSECYLQRLREVRGILAAPLVTTGPAQLPAPAVTVAPSGSGSGAGPDRPGRAPRGNAGGPRSSTRGPESLAARRERAAVLLQERGPLTRKELARLLGVSGWIVTQMMRGWDAVEHTTASKKSPYRLKASPAPAPSAGPPA